MSSTPLRISPVVLILSGALGSIALATSPFTEDFTSSNANWADSSGMNLATFVTSGGPDGSSYISATVDTSSYADGDGVTVFRGQDEFDSSNHAFEGNWLAGGIKHFVHMSGKTRRCRFRCSLDFPRPATFPVLRPTTARLCSRTRGPR